MPAGWNRRPVADDSRGDGAERIGRNQTVTPPQAPQAPGHGATVRGGDRRQGALHREPPDPGEDQQNEDVHGDIEQGERRKKPEPPERGEQTLHGARERHDGNQGERQVEGTPVRLLEEGHVAVDERYRQCDGQRPAGETDRQGGADAFRDGRLFRRDEILRALLGPRREEHTEKACERCAQGEAAAPFRQQHPGQKTLDRDAEDDPAALGREHGGCIPSARRARTGWRIRFHRCHGVDISLSVIPEGAKNLSRREETLRSAQAANSERLPPGGCGTAPSRISSATAGILMKSRTPRDAAIFFALEPSLREAHPGYPARGLGPAHASSVRGEASWCHASCLNNAT